MDTREPTLVIAHYNEDLSWAEGRKSVIIHKDIDIPNVGREISTFFYFIVTNYTRLEGDYVFLQGRPNDHAPRWYDGNFGETTRDRKDGSPHHGGLDIHSVCRELDLPLLDEYEFIIGGQFKVSAEKIKQRSWEWYTKALYLSTQGNNPWIFERLWSYIF